MATTKNRISMVVLATIVCAALSIAFSCISSTKAYAGAIPASNGAKAVCVWTQGKTYKKIDVTGDKKVDKVKYTFKKNTFKLYVNNKTVFSKKCVGYTPPILVRLKNGKSFIQIDVVKKNGKSIVAGLFQCRSGKLSQKLSYSKMFKKKGYIFSGSGISNVSGNTISFYSNGSNASGTKYCYANASYTYKGNALKANSKTTYMQM